MRGILSLASAMQSSVISLGGTLTVNTTSQVAENLTFITINMFNQSVTLRAYMSLLNNCVSDC